MDARLREKLAQRASGAVDVQEYGAIAPGANVYNPSDIQARFRAKMAARGGVEMTADPSFQSPQDRYVAGLEGHIERLERELDATRKAMRAKAGAGGEQAEKLGKELEAANAEIERLEKLLGEAKGKVEQLGARVLELEPALEMAKAEAANAKASLAKAEADLEQATKPAAPEGSKAADKPADKSAKRG